jgi:hypothetical protein
VNANVSVIESSETNPTQETILDATKRTSSRGGYSREQWWWIFVYVLTGLILYVFINDYWGDRPKSLLLSGLMLWSLMKFKIFLHELGHLLAGLLVGFQPQEFVVTPIELSRWGPRWRWSWLSRPNFYGGWVSSTPRDAHGLRWRNMVFILGGPLMDLIGLAVCVGLIWTLKPNSSDSSWFGQPGFYLAALAAWSVWFVLGNLQPRDVPGAGSGNDSKLLLKAWRGGPVFEGELFAYPLHAQSQDGVRPRDWRADWMASMVAVMDHAEFDAGAAFQPYFWALDRGDLTLAGTAMDRLIAGQTSLSRSDVQWLLLEATYFEAFHRQNPVLARTFFARALKPKQDDDSTFLRAEAALLLADGFPHAAIERAEHGLKLLEGYSWLSGVYRGSMDWLNAVLERAKLEVASAPEETEILITTHAEEVTPFNPTLAGTVLIAFALGLTDLGVTGIVPNGLPQLIAIIVALALMLKVIVPNVFKVAGTRVGFRFVHRPGDKTPVVRQHSGRPSDFLGVWMSSGPDDNTDLIERTATMLRQGLIICAGVGLILFTAGVWLEPTHSEPSQITMVFWFVAQVLRIAGLLALIYGLGSLLSLLGVHVFAVGWRLRTLAHGGNAALRDASRNAWLAAASRGVRPRDWHPAWLEACAVDAVRNTEDVHTLAGAYFAAADRGEITLARTYFDHAWSNLAWVAGHQRNAFWLERAYLLARDGDAVEARAVLNQVAVTGVDFVSRQRASAAVLLAEGHFEQAIRAAQSGREAMHQSWNGGLVLAEMDWLDMIALEAQEQLRIVSDSSVEPVMS